MNEYAIWGSGGGEGLLGAVELDAVVASSVQVLCCVCEAFLDLLYLLARRRVWFFERHSHDVALELDIACGDRVLLYPRLHLASRMTDLTNDKASVCFTRGSQPLEGIESLTLWFFGSGDDRIASGFELIVFHHDVACEDRAQLALAPPLVDIDQVIGGNATSFKVLGIPRGDSLSHGGFEEAVWGCFAAEFELEGLA